MAWLLGARTRDGRATGHPKHGDVVGPSGTPERAQGLGKKVRQGGVRCDPGSWPPKGGGTRGSARESLAPLGPTAQGRQLDRSCIEQTADTGSGFGRGAWSHPLGGAQVSVCASGLVRWTGWPHTENTPPAQGTSPAWTVLRLRRLLQAWPARQLRLASKCRL